MTKISDALAHLQQLAPLELAEDWDNVGLLIGNQDAELHTALTCLTLTPDVVQEAIRREADLVISHHPLPFRGVKTLTTGSIDGGSLWRLIGAGTAVYSPHTAYDSAENGVNAQWAERLRLSEVQPLEAIDGRTDGAGVGRIGNFGAGDFDALVEAIKSAANLSVVRVVPPASGEEASVAVACGSGGSLLDRAIDAGCTVFLTGELSFHDCLRCRSLGIGVVLTGHYASERFAVETLAERLSEALPGVVASASADERDPLSEA